MLMLLMTEGTCPVSLPQTTYGSAAVLDMVSFGLRRVFADLKALLLLAAPVVLYTALTSSALQTMTSLSPTDFQGGDLTNPKVMGTLMMTMVLIPFSLLGYLAMAYLMYVNMKYLTDALLGQVSANLWSYYKPDKRLLGWLGLIAIYSVGLVMMVVIIAIGFILLIIPGLLLLLGSFYLYGRLFLASSVYFLDPDAGVMDSFGVSWRLVDHQQFWRAMALLMVSGLLLSLISLPFSLVNAVLSFVTTLSQSGGGQFFGAISPPVVFVMMLVSTLLVYMMQIGVVANASYCIQTRFLFDLMDRNPTALLASQSGLPLASETEGDETAV